MFQDSFSEGHIYWGRVAILFAGVITIAYLAAQL